MTSSVAPIHRISSLFFFFHGLIPFSGLVRLLYCFLFLQKETHFSFPPCFPAVFKIPRTQDKVKKIFNLNIFILEMSYFLSNGSERFIFLNKSSETCNPQIPNASTSDKALMTTGYVILLFVSLAGNALIIAVFFKKHDQLQTPVNYFIINMAVSDFLVPIFVLPRRIQEVYLGWGPWLVSGVLGDIICKVASFADEVSIPFHRKVWFLLHPKGYLLLYSNISDLSYRIEQLRLQSYLPGCSQRCFIPIIFSPTRWLLKTKPLCALSVYHIFFTLGRTFGESTD